MRLEDIQAGIQVDGIEPGRSVEIVAVVAYGADAVSVTFGGSRGLDQQMLFRDDEAHLLPAEQQIAPFDVEPRQFKIAAEAQRVALAGRHDPMLAVATSDVQPLPHQIRAVYGELLPRTPLRYLLADDPGAGKTIMAGLYIKELLLRDDVRRCLIVAPGGLVEQWQDELFLKFGITFEILTPQMTEASLHQSVFDKHPLLIARMDQLARNEELLSQAAESEWDLVIVDEAHRMSASWWGGELNKTKRYQLGEMLGERSRHFLLMTATPHAGSEENFQAFLRLLDRDAFSGRYRSAMGRVDTQTYMRRMIKEDLLTFEGKPLFPERVAETVPYELVGPELDLYEAVTDYVRQGMDRAERLTKGRRNTIGFALTVLQRRLASSPAAIHESLKRRIARLEKRRADLESGVGVRDVALPGSVDLEVSYEDDLSAFEVEQLEDELVDAATAAETVVELGAELLELDHLKSLAARVRASGEDIKWRELRSILEDNEILAPSDSDRPRRLIIFTEHRDTLEYLRTLISGLLGPSAVVESIHGGVPRAERRRITEEFTKNPRCRVLLATDAAGEGLNLQAAHLMVNYDLPWNPNRIEQRFGRIHRIGQTEVCRLWNLVAQNTREGQVFERLLEKVDEQRKAYGGKVFDVLGQAFEKTPLRTLLLDAIKHGELPETRARMHEVIDASVSVGLDELLRERALASETLASREVEKMRRAMDEARIRRLQPHYIEMAFRTAFGQLGGRMARREAGRFEITVVPAPLRQGRSPVASRYERVCFDLPHVDHDTAARADLLAPGHPLHDAVIERALERWGPDLRRGTVLASPFVLEPQLLLGVTQEIRDGTGEILHNEFRYAFTDERGAVVPAGVAPYLDCASSVPDDVAKKARSLSWTSHGTDRAVTHLVSHDLADLVGAWRSRRGAETAKVREAVVSRLDLESRRLREEFEAAREKERTGRMVDTSSETWLRRVQEIESRRDERLALISRQAHVSAQPPDVMAQAIVIPVSWVEDVMPADEPLRARQTRDVHCRAVEAVLSAERRLGRSPQVRESGSGLDILSRAPDGSVVMLTVKGRRFDHGTFFVTHNEVVTGKNSQPDYRLALVSMSAGEAGHEEVRYVDDPFASMAVGSLDSEGVACPWEATWARGHDPS